MRRHPAVAEGDLSWMRQVVVDRDSCAAAAAAAGLDAAFVGAAPAARRQAAAELAERVTVRAALAEAVIGAAWLDLGPEQTRAAVVEAFGPALDAATPGERDPKTTLQERAARRHLLVGLRAHRHPGAAAAAGLHQPRAGGRRGAGARHRLLQAGLRAPRRRSRRSRRMPADG